MRRSGSEAVPEPWGPFLRALDGLLEGPVDLHCLGGFAMTMQYGLSRTTSDIDILTAIPTTQLARLHSIAGEGSTLERKFGVYLQPVRIITYPEDYEARLVPMWPNAGFAHLRLFALEAHDLALTKLERNSDIDREDVQGLANAGFINEATLRERYTKEYRPNLAALESKHDLTVELWIDMCWPKKSEV